MKLKDILDMEEYLQNRCYCPNEIYSDDGFFYQLFDKEEEYEYIGECNDSHNFIAVTAKSKDGNIQLLLIYRNEILRNIDDIIRYDATIHNVNLIYEFIDGRKEKAHFDKYVGNKTSENLAILKKHTDMIMVN